MTHTTLPSLHDLVLDTQAMARMDALSRDAAATLADAPLQGAHVLDVSLVAASADEAAPVGTRVHYWAQPPRSAHHAIVRAAWEPTSLAFVHNVALALGKAFDVPHHRIDASLSAHLHEDGFSWAFTATVWTGQARIAFAPKGQGACPSQALERFVAACRDILAMPPDALHARLHPTR